MGEIEDHIITRATEFNRTDDWPQAFEAFTPPGGNRSETVAAIRRMQHEGRLAVGHFEAGPESADVVLGLGHI
jgi:hypothetical protein